MTTPPAICKNCRRVLNTVDDYDDDGNLLRCGYEHPEPLPGVHCPKMVPEVFEGDERHPDQVTVCDFCGTAGAVWDFPARDFVVPSDDHLTQVGTWASCDGCRPLVEAKRWDAVLDRYFRVNPDQVDSPALRQHLRTMYAVFDACRMGEPVPS